MRIEFALKDAVIISGFLFAVLLAVSLSYENSKRMDAISSSVGDYAIKTNDALDVAHNHLVFLDKESVIWLNRLDALDSNSMNLTMDIADINYRLRNGNAINAVNLLNGKKDVKVYFAGNFNHNATDILLGWANEVYFCHNFTEANAMNASDLIVLTHNVLPKEYQEMYCGDTALNETGGCFFHYLLNGTYFPAISLMPQPETLGGQWEKGLVLHELGHSLDLPMDQLNNTGLEYQQWNILLLKDYLEVCAT